MFARRALILVLTAFLAAVSAAAAAAAPRPLTGIVLSDSGAPIPHALVRLPGYAAETDSLGRFRFPDVPPGQYRMIVIRAGFDPNCAPETLSIPETAPPQAPELRLSCNRVKPPEPYVEPAIFVRLRNEGDVDIDSIRVQYSVPPNVAIPLPRGAVTDYWKIGTFHGGDDTVRIYARGRRLAPQTCDWWGAMVRGWYTLALACDSDLALTARMMGDNPPAQTPAPKAKPAGKPSRRGGRGR